MTVGDRIKTRQQLLDEQADTATTPATRASNARTTARTSINRRQR
jgi:hypothetical protein